MTAIEQASEQAGVSTDVLMENAGLAVALAARSALGGIAGLSVTVLVGPGNNGADGLVAARHLRRWGGEVTCYVTGTRPGTDPKMAWGLEYGLQMVHAKSDPSLEKLTRLLGSSRLVIDAVLGTGRARPLQGRLRDILLCLSEVRTRPRRPLLIALDLPTGLNADTGELDPACPGADVALALGYPKRGLLAFPGAGSVGRLTVLDIGVPPGLAEEQEIGLELLTKEWVARRLPPRPPNSHKGTFGHALVVAGSRNYSGAAYLASQACVRTGAGLTTLASPQGVYPIAAAKSAEVIHLPLPEDDDGRISAAAASLVHRAPRPFSAMLVGCGLGWSAGTTDFLQRLLFDPAALDTTSPVLPVLIDADGLNNLSDIADWETKTHRPLVLTPHPGEMSTLTGRSTAEIQDDRLGVAQEYAARWNAVLVLKGANTIIARPDGSAHVAPFINPGLATGGTGDVLSGVITGLMAQGLSPSDAACCGVYLHGDSGEEVSSRLGNAGTTASDLLDGLPAAINRVR